MNRQLSLALLTLAISCSEPPASRLPHRAAESLALSAATRSSTANASLATASAHADDAETSPPPNEEPSDLAVEPPTELPVFNAGLVRALGPDRVRLLEVAASVCGAAVRADENGVLRVGCRTCPPFTREYGPDGTIVELSKGDNFYELEHASFGSFTRVGADEVAATFAGCESYAGNYGGTLIAERKAPGSAIWVARSYRSGLHPDRCEPLTLADTRRLLVCTWVTGKQVTSENLVVYDFSKGTEDDVSETAALAFGVEEDLYSACFNGALPGRLLQSGAIERFAVQPSGASVSKVVLDVVYGTAKPGPAFNALCKRVIDENDKENGRPIDLNVAVSRKKYRLTFVWNGAELTLDKDSAKRWKAAQPTDPPLE